jgi:hypothetical protein
MMLRRPAGGKAAVELAREAALCEATVPLSCSFVPKHAVPRALDKAFVRSVPVGQLYPQGSNRVHP